MDTIYGSDMRKNRIIINRVILLLSCLVMVPDLYANFDTREESDSFIVVLRGPSLSVSTFDARRQCLYKGLSCRPRQIRQRIASHRRHLENRQRLFEDRLKSKFPAMRVRRRYTGLLNGLCIEMPSQQASQLRDLPEVLAIVPNRRYHRFLTQSNTLMQIHDAWQELGGALQAGQGIKIGIMDTGIDHSHIMFDDAGYEYPPGFPLGDTAFVNKKIIVARVFAQPGDVVANITPRDLEGHGTHVASCAAGRLNTPSPLGLISGVAPNAYLGNYKIFTDEATSLEQILAALEACVEDGMDVINMSLGSDAYVNILLDPEAIAIKNALKAGVVVVVAAGNSGEAESIGSPGQIPDIITVGSVTNAHDQAGPRNTFLALMNVYADGDRIVTEEEVVLGPNPDFFSSPILGRFPLVDADRLDGDAVADDQRGLVCQDRPLDRVAEGWILVRRGICTFTSKIDRVQAAGGHGALIYNPIDANEPQDETVQSPSVPGTRIPSYFTSWLTGSLLKEALGASNLVEVEFQALPVSARSQNPFKLSSFSSMGPSLDFGVKPEILAVGGGSYGATQDDLPGTLFFRFFEPTSFDPSGFNFSSGTSFSAPRVAGVAALLIQKHPQWTPADIKSALVISARRPSPIAALSSTQRGGGYVDPIAAMNLPVLVTPATLSWEKVVINKATATERAIQVKNVSGQTQSISISHAQAVSVRGGAAEIVPSQFDLAPFESREVRVRMNFSPPPNLGDFWDTEGDLVIEIAGQPNAPRVPMWARTMKAPARSQQQVLLVDDDGGESIERQYVAALRNAGYDSVHWNVNTLDSYPTQRYMQPFPIVVWFMGSSSLNVPSAGAAFEPFNRRIRFNVALTRYLARGGRLLLSGMDWSDQQEHSSFGQQVLHIRHFEQDAFVTYSSNGTVQTQQRHLSITAVRDSPIAPGLSGLSADFDATVPNLSDILSLDSNAIAKPALIANRNVNDVIGMTVETSSYRTVFCAFPLERLSAQGMDRILQNSLDWLIDGPKMNLSLLSIEPTVQHDNRMPLPATLLLEGLNFFIGHDVFFDDIPVEITGIQMPGTVEINVPGGLLPRRYDITLRSPDGQETRLSAAFTVEKID